MKERILRLCKRLDKFSLDEIEMVSELESEELMPILSELKRENKLIQKGNSYFYNKVSATKRTFGNLPLCFQFHSKEEIDYILKGFCCDIEVLKMIDLFGLTKHTLDKFYKFCKKSQISFFVLGNSINTNVGNFANQSVSVLVCNFFCNLF